MSEGLLSLGGVTVPPADLGLPRARALAEAASAGIVPYVALIGAQRLGDPNHDELVVFDVDVEVPQHPVYDIRALERVAVRISHDDARPPETLALRGDFPLVPHLNLTLEEYPRSLCLYDEPWQDLKLIWTAAAHLARTREWLRLTARGETHEVSQPLEPLMLGPADTLVLPADLSVNTDDGAALPLRLQRVGKQGRRLTIVAEWSSSDSEGDRTDQQSDFVATIIEVPPTVHGVIRKQPVTLLELGDILVRSGTDLIALLRDRLRAWHQRGELQQLISARLVLIVLLPKVRLEDGETESVEAWAFLTLSTVAELGEQIGLWQLRDGVPGWFFAPDESKRGSEAFIGPMDPMRPFTREQAALLNGSKPVRDRVVLIGAGALGSQVFLNLMRSGFGEWTLVDEDLLFPHNLARHALFGFAIGMPKAEILADLAKDTIAGAPIASALVADLTNPAAEKEQLAERIAAADVILDCSASIGVARHLTHDAESSGRRASYFLNRSGRDAVLLVEDRQRVWSLDLLEMQYYRAVLHEESLVHHFAAYGGRLRYGVGCRDQSAVLSQDLIALHAANGSRALKGALSREDPTALVWRAQDDFSVLVTPVAIHPPIHVVHNGWTVTTDSAVMEELRRLRGKKLPNETGGILIGAFDVAHRIIFIAAVVPSPADSTEWPTLYIRGKDGLRDQVSEVERRTGGNLRYVGEWHAHPNGHDCAPSDDDRTVLAWLQEAMAHDGLPAVVLIVGEQDACFMVGAADAPARIRRPA